MLAACGGLVPYLVAVLAFSFIVVLFASVRNQNQLFKSHEDLFGLIQLLLPVNLDRFRELFDPAQEWNLKVRHSSEAFKLIQRNRRKLAIRYATNMYRNAHILQKIGYAAIHSNNPDRALRGKIVVDAGVPVRLRSVLLLLFLRFQQFTYTACGLSAVRDIAKDLLPEYSDLVNVASSLSRELDPKLHESLIELI